MSITSISIVPIFHEEAELPLEIAIGQPIIIDIQCNGSNMQNDIVIAYLQVDTDPYPTYLQKKGRLDDSGKTRIKFSKTWGLKTSPTVGLYRIKVTNENGSIIQTLDDAYEVSILTTWMLRNVHCAGIDMVDYYGNPLDDAVLQMAVDTAIGMVERDIHCFLYPKKVIMTDRNSSDTGDVYVDPIAFYRSNQYVYGYGILHHQNIISIDKIEAWYNDLKIWEFPASWAQYHSLSGHFWLMPTTLAGLSTAAGIAYFSSVVKTDFVPNFWRLNYTSGWDEERAPFPSHLIQAIGWKATMSQLWISGDALSPGISSQSLNMDGISEEKRTTASAIYFLFSARIEGYRKEYEGWRKDWMAYQYVKPMVSA